MKLLKEIAQEALKETEESNPFDKPIKPVPKVLNRDFEFIAETAKDMGVNSISQLYVDEQVYIEFDRKIDIKAFNRVSDKHSDFGGPAVDIRRAEFEITIFADPGSGKTSVAIEPPAQYRGADVWQKFKEYFDDVGITYPRDYD